MAGKAASGMTQSEKTGHDEARFGWRGVPWMGVAQSGLARTGLVRLA